jgi:hypothetical protein
VTMTLKDRVKGRVKFVRFNNGELWYVTEDGFEFPVPTNDAGNAVFLAEDKGILFMRYIRKHMTMLLQARHDAGLR